MYKKNNFNSESKKFMKKQKVLRKKIYKVENRNFIVMNKKEIKRLKISKKIFKEFILEDSNTQFDSYNIEIVNIQNNNKEYVVEIKIKNIIFQLIS